MSLLPACESYLPAIPWVCSMKLFQLSPAAPCAQVLSAAAAVWNSARGPSPLHCTSSFQPSIAMSLCSGETFCKLYSRGRVCSGNRGSRAWHFALYRANKSWHPVDHHWQAMHEMGWGGLGQWTDHFLFIYFSQRDRGLLISCHLFSGVSRILFLNEKWTDVYLNEKLIRLN